jgi:hypothetical protein
VIHSLGDKNRKELIEIIGIQIEEYQSLTEELNQERRKVHALTRRTEIDSKDPT